LKGLDCRNPKDFVEILQTINRDLSLGLDPDDTSFAVSVSPAAKTVSKPKQVIQPENNANEKKNKPYTVIQKEMPLDELSYWNQYGISYQILKLFNVIAIKDFSSVNSEDKPFSFSSSQQEPIFGYTGKRHIKIYRPFSQVRFLYGGTLGDNYCFGLEQLPAKGDTLFITGGEKDVMSLFARGFHAICFNSETCNIPKNLIHKLSYRFKHIVLLYDVDKTGLESSLKQEQQLSDLGVKRLVLPLSGTKQEKDISDYFRLGNTRKDFIQLFIEFLDNLYSETMAILKPCEIDFNNPPENAEMIISINDVPIGTQGNLLGITGGEGTGKSNFVGALIAGAIRQTSPIDTLGTDVLLNGDKKAILLYDTEQSEVQLYKNMTNISRRSKQGVLSCFRAYCLTSMSRKERMQAIVQSMDKAYYELGGIHLVVIDGIADLVRCANDEAESVSIIDELYRLAGIYKTCIICVLHFVPNGMKLRGHLGSELQRKAAGILSVERDENPKLSVVKALKVRDGSPLDVPLIQFGWSRERAMHVYMGEKPKEEKEKRKETELEGVARTIFGKQRCFTYLDLCEQIQSALDVKERTAKSYVKFMREKDIILKDSTNANYYILGTI
jgi:hypothetical protein